MVGAVSMSAVTTSFWCPFYLPATELALALALALAPGTARRDVLLPCAVLPLSWLCLYGLLCAFDEAKMARKMVGNGLCVFFFVSEWGLWELEVGSKATLWGGSIKRKAISAFCLPECLPAFLPSSHPAILPSLLLLNYQPQKWTSPYL